MTAGLHLGELQCQSYNVFQSPFKRGNDCGLYLLAEAEKNSLAFQSPFKRGNDCGVIKIIAELQSKTTFQSPFKRGNDCGVMWKESPSSLILMVSIPFQAGQ